MGHTAANQLNLTQKKKLTRQQPSSVCKRSGIYIQCPDKFAFDYLDILGPFVDANVSVGERIAVFQHLH